MPNFPPFSEHLLQELCDILGDTSDGLSGSEISSLLTQCGIDNIGSSITKRHRLYQALNTRQRQEERSNTVLAFLQAAMDPLRYSQQKERFDYFRYSLNTVLAEVNFQIGTDGKIRIVARRLTEAEQRASRLRNTLIQRGAHADVLHLCKAELLRTNYLPVIIEATRSLAEKIRQKTNSTQNGLALLDAAFGLEEGIPKLAFNTLQSESEKAEHHALVRLMKGILGAFQEEAFANADWSMNEQDALDILAIISMLHRKLDQAVPTGK